MGITLPDMPDISYSRGIKEPKRHSKKTPALNRIIDYLRENGPSTLVQISGGKDYKAIKQVVMTNQNLFVKIGKTKDGHKSKIIWGLKEPNP